MDLSGKHIIKLTRHGKKLWSYKGSPPDVVEIATLHCLRDRGFDGYFTGRDRYLELLMSLAGWPSTDFKSMVGYFSLTENVYFGTSDGSRCWQNKYTFDKLIGEARSIGMDRLHEKIENFSKRRNKLQYLGSESAKPEHVKAFLAAYGLDRIKADIERLYSREEFDTRNLLWKISSEIWSEARHVSVHTSGVMNHTRPPDLLWFALHSKANDDTSLFDAHLFAASLNDPDFRRRIIEVCQIAEQWKRRRLATQSEVRLDLMLWDSTGITIVEVKAPNDSLRPGQIKTINEAISRGEKAGVISVVEE